MALWHNLGEAAERAVSRHREHLHAAIPEPARTPAAAVPLLPAPPPEARRTGRIADRTRARHAEVHRLLAQNRGYREIAAALGLSRKTVRRFARAATPEELLVHGGTGRQPSILDEHADYLRER
jgi:DNA-binding NarL/FixJ family response regulator